MVNNASLVVYLPVFHRGYLELFQRHSYVRQAYIVGRKLLDEVGYHEKEIRALDPGIARSIVATLGLLPTRILTPENVTQLNPSQVIAASDEVTRAIAEKYWPNGNVEWDTAFLRWDTQRVFSQEPAGYDRVSEDPEDRKFLEKALAVSKLTSDWWRQVGAVLVKDGEVWAVKYNLHLPSEHTPYALGDPRDFVQAGVRSELASAIHCEQQIVAMAAHEGVSLKDTSLYVTVFPCPVCAKLIALSGIKKCCFLTGHASLNGAQEMQQAGVELVWVRT